MGNKDVQKKYSLRKFKGIGLASAVIGLFFANQSVYANVTADGKDETTIVGEFDKVSSRAKTTFTDDKDSTKKVTVDAVADIRYKKPTKANYNTGDADGKDSLKYHSEATVNYLLETDNSKLQDSKTVEGEKTTVTTPYDKKGIAYDTDGKDYRESSVEKRGEAVTEDTGKVENIKANDKEYTLVRSEVVGKDKATYDKIDKTKFNDIEAPVSPEGMHNNLGEINYGKITGKVYLVEETSDGHYGKYVEASNINSDEEAVNAWKNGQATAKEFTKENVTLKEGDTVLVMDRDTYAHGSGKRTVNTVEYRRKKIAAKPEYNYTEAFERTEGIPGSPTYAFWMQPKTGEFPTIGDDYIFGTADDGKVNFKDENILYYNNISKSLPPGITDSNKYNFKNESLEEILEEMHAQINGILEYFDRNVNNETDRKEVQARKEELKQNIAKTIEMIKQNQIKVAVEDERGLMFSQANPEILKQLRTQIEEAQNVLGDLNISLGTSVETLPEYKQLKNVTLTKKGVLKYSRIYGFASGVIKSYHKDAEPEHITDWEKVNPEVETKEDSIYANKGVVTISDDLSKIKVVHTDSNTTEFELTKQEANIKEETDYVVKELITPIRAYKVMSEGNVVVNHFYKEVVKKSEVPESKGGVNGELDNPLTLPQLIITKWVDEYGNTLKPADAKNPSVEGQANEAFEPGTIEGYEFVGTIPVDADGIVTHVFKKKQAYKPEESKPELKPQQTPEPKPEEPKKEDTKKEEPKQNDATPSHEGNEHQTSVPTKKVEELPQTGTGQEFAIFGAAASSILAGLGLVMPGKQRKE